MNFLNSRQIWEVNVAMIHKHNLEFDRGLHSYTLKMNQFGDMVNILKKYTKFFKKFFAQRQMKNFENK